MDDGDLVDVGFGGAAETTLEAVDLNFEFGLSETNKNEVDLDLFSNIAKGKDEEELFSFQTNNRAADRYSASNNNTFDLLSASPLPDNEDSVDLLMSNDRHSQSTGITGDLLSMLDPVPAADSSGPSMDFPTSHGADLDLLSGNKPGCVDLFSNLPRDEGVDGQDCDVILGTEEASSVKGLQEDSVFITPSAIPGSGYNGNNINNENLEKVGFTERKVSISSDISSARTTSVSLGSEESDFCEEDLTAQPTMSAGEAQKSATAKTARSEVMVSVSGVQLSMAGTDVSQDVISEETQDDSENLVKEPLMPDSGAEELHLDNTIKHDEKVEQTQVEDGMELTLDDLDFRAAQDVMDEESSRSESQSSMKTSSSGAVMTAATATPDTLDFELDFGEDSRSPVSPDNGTAGVDMDRVTTDISLDLDPNSQQMSQTDEDKKADFMLAGLQQAREMKNDDDNNGNENSELPIIKKQPEIQSTSMYADDDDDESDEESDDDDEKMEVEEADKVQLEKDQEVIKGVDMYGDDDSEEEIEVLVSQSETNKVQDNIILTDGNSSEEELEVCVPIAETGINQKKDTVESDKENDISFKEPEVETEDVLVNERGDEDDVNANISDTDDINIDTPLVLIDETHGKISELVSLDSHYEDSSIKPEKEEDKEPCDENMDRIIIQDKIEQDREVDDGEIQITMEEIIHQAETITNSDLEESAIDTTTIITDPGIMDNNTAVIDNNLQKQERLEKEIDDADIEISIDEGNQDLCREKISVQASPGEAPPSEQNELVSIEEQATNQPDREMVEEEKISIAIEEEKYTNDVQQKEDYEANDEDININIDSGNDDFSSLQVDANADGEEEKNIVISANMYGEDDDDSGSDFEIQQSPPDGESIKQIVSVNTSKSIMYVNSDNVDDIDDDEEVEVTSEHPDVSKEVTEDIDNTNRREQQKQEEEVTRHLDEIIFQEEQNFESDPEPPSIIINPPSPSWLTRQPSQEEEIIISSIHTKEKEDEDDFDFDLPTQPVLPPSQNKQNDPVLPAVTVDQPMPSCTGSPGETQASHPAEVAQVTTSDTPHLTSLDNESQINGSHVDTKDQAPIKGILKPATVEESSSDEENETLAAAEAEWDGIQTITPKFQAEGDRRALLPDDIKACQLISFNEVLQYFQTKDLSQYKGQIRTSIQRRGFAAFKHMLFGPPNLHRDLVDEKNLIFCMAACPLDNEDELHMRVLQTVYRRLTGSKFDCQRYGGHWEVIGFQGNDPATDLRGSGFLGLMHLLNMVTDPMLFALSKDIYRLSLHETQNFPFCLMGINITRITLQALREDCLNKEGNKRKQVVGVVNDFYAGCYYHLYDVWKKQHKTIADSGFVIRDLETFAKKNPRAILKNLDIHRIERRKNDKGDADDQPVKFIDVCDFDD